VKPLPLAPLLSLSALSALSAFGASACDGDLTPVEPARTVRVVAGTGQLVGSEGTGCSYGEAPAQEFINAVPERWCAFYRKAPDGMYTELWTVNVSKALKDGPDTCDGSSPSCRLLSASLWTGEPVFSPSHPYIHGFEGDTLIFYSDSGSLKSDEAYVGPVRGWRPGMPAAQVLTGGRGVLCVGQLRSDGVLCIENQSSGGEGLQFDLAAGSLSASAGGTVPNIERVRPYDARGALMWQVAFSPNGQYLAFSTQAADAPVERLRIVETAQLGRAPPREIARDVARWQFSPDGQRLFFLRGYQYTAEQDATGTLAVADFPAMTGSTDLALRVSRYQVHPGDRKRPALGVSLFQDVTDSYGSFRIMPDVARPAEMVTIAQMIEDARVSPDRRFTFFYDFDDQGESISVLARNDGSGRCILNAKMGHAAFGLVFPGNDGPVFWGEDSVDNPAFNEGWFADPVACGPKVRFTNKLAYLQATQQGAVFGEEEEGRITMGLLHARATAAGGSAPLTIERLATGADTTVALLDNRYLVFTINQGDPATAGLYIHGPLP
jgi:hypothetical protein